MAYLLSNNFRVFFFNGKISIVFKRIAGLSSNGKFTKVIESYIKDVVNFLLPKSTAFWEQDKHILRGFSIESLPVIWLSFKGNQFYFRTIRNLKIVRLPANRLRHAYSYNTRVHSHQFHQEIYQIYKRTQVYLRLCLSSQVCISFQT